MTAAGSEDAPPPPEHGPREPEGPAAGRVPPSEDVTRPPRGSEPGPGFDPDADLEEEVPPWLAETRRPVEPGASTQSIDPRRHGAETTPLGGGTTEALHDDEDHAITRRGPVGRYLVEGILGRGGMGVVYKAYDPQLKRHVALKLIRRSLSGRLEMFHRFLAEAQVTAQLQHPAIVPVYDMGRTRKRDLFYTMRLVDGRTLTDVVQEALDTHDSERDLSLFRILQSFVLACRAMAYAHSRGVLHRDLKPDNIMIGRFGQVYLMDAGVAKVLSDSTVTADEPRRDLPFSAEEIVETSPKSATAVGTILGTPAYMAPEQAAGSNDELAPATDVYSLGAILYHVLTGLPPISGSATEILGRIAKGTPPDLPSARRENVPAELERIVMDSLEYDPKKRLHSAEELASAIEAFLEGRSLQAASAEDAEFLRSYTSTVYRKPSVAVDVVLITRPDPGGRSAAFLHRRLQPPFAGRWSLPGGFVQLEESLTAAARRVVAAQAGAAEGVALEPLGSYDSVHRDPRTRVISMAFLAVVDEAFPLPAGGGAWVEVRRGPELGEPAAAGDRLAFDHARILQDALDRLELA